MTKNQANVNRSFTFATRSFVKMKYFRTYPWLLQMLLFVLMVFTFMSGISAIIYSLLPKFTGFMPAQMSGLNSLSPVRLINATLVVQGIFNLCVFGASAYLFAYLAHPDPRKYIGLKAPGKKIQPVLAVLVMLGAMPLLEGISYLIGLIPFGTQVKAAQQANDEMMRAFLTIPDMGSFIRVFIVMAVIPGFGEELFFRGILLRFSRKKTSNMVIPVLFTASVFAFVHSNIYGFLSIMLAGVLLAVIYNLTGSIWCSILGHIFFNGTQVILAYAGNFSPAIKAYTNSDTISVIAIVAGAIVFAGSFYLLLKNKTPLPDNWTDDFTDLYPAVSDDEEQIW